MLQELRRQGLRTIVLEMADAVGGTWLVNRYPGARCDIESIEYSYSFSEEIQQDWVWTETMPTQPEIEAYLNFVADRLDLRRDIRLDTSVVAMAFDEDACEWLIDTATGEQFARPFVVAASGILSVPLEPDIAGMATFDGASLYTSRWPAGGFDFTGKRVGVIGTGSTGVRMILVVAREAAHLTVFQRSRAYTLPWQVRPFEPDELKANYGEIRAAQRTHPVGAARLSAFSVLINMLSRPPIRSASRADQRRAIDEDGVMGALNWGDIFFDIEANRMTTSLYGEAIARIVRDASTTAALVPTHPGRHTRRPAQRADQHGHANRDPDRTRLPRTRRHRVRHRLRRDDRRTDPHRRPGPRRPVTQGLLGPRKSVVLPRTRRRGLPEPLHHRGSARAARRVDRPVPDSPAGQRKQTIEALASAQTEWIEHAAALVAPTVLVHPSCNSWYNGGNVPGKKRMYMGYTAGIPEYRRRCDEIAANGYVGFKLG